MRLIPSCVRSSDRDTDENTGDGDPLAGLTIDENPSIDAIRSGELIDDTRGSELVPEDDSELVESIATLETPATIDEVTDQLVQSRHHPLETWATVHEQLHQRRLPALDDADRVEFDVACGVVNVPADQSGSHERPTCTAVVSRAVQLVSRFRYS